jgi:hypothetical protein
MPTQRILLHLFGLLPIGIIPADNQRRSPRLKSIFWTKDGSEISLTFYAMITPVDATVSTLQMQLIIITGIMMLLATMLAIIISKHISNPIEQINQSAKKHWQRVIMKLSSWQRDIWRLKNCPTP